MANLGHQAVQERSSPEIPAQDNQESLRHRNQTPSRSFREQCEEYLAQPVNSLNLVLFRIIYGLVMCFHIYRIMYWQKTLQTNFESAELNFHYWFAERVPHLPLSSLRVVYMVCCISAFCLGIGLFYRLACFVFLVTYTYQNLLEKTRYNNHFYLYILLSFFFLITDANKRLTLDSYLRKCLRQFFKEEKENPEEKLDKRVPFWQVFLFQFQLFVVYFYAGIAKINYDWALRGEPMRTWGYYTRFPLLRDLVEVVLPEFLVQDFIGYFYSLGGLLFDLLVGFFLLAPKLRVIGILFSLFFHVMNHFLFTIGTFPWLMIGSNVIFIHQDTIENLILEIKKYLVGFGSNVSTEPSTGTSRQKGAEITPRSRAKLPQPIKSFLVVYLVVQLLLPFRHWLYPGNVNWTLEGHQFSWRMMLNEEQVMMRFNIKSVKTGKEKVFNPYDLRMNVRQVKRMLTDSDLVLQLVKHIKTNHLPPGEDATITVDMWKALNNRPYQRYVNGSVDLTRVNPWAFTHEWITPQFADYIDFTELRNTKAEWQKRGYETSFFMDKPGETHSTSFLPEYCEDVRLFALTGDINIQMGRDATRLRPGDSVTVPSDGAHSVTPTGHATTIWYYVYDCHISQFQQSQMYLGVMGWKFRHLTPTLT